LPKNKQILKKTLKIILPLLIGAGILYYYLSKFTDEQLEEIIVSIKNADFKWLVVSLIFGLLSHIIRAYRWDYLLDTLGYHPKKTNLVLTVGLSYLLNLAVPRAGEIGRAASLAKYEKDIDFDKAFGTIVAERMADIFFLLLFIALAFFFQFDLIYEMISEKIPKNPILLSVEIVGLIVVFYFFLQWLKKSDNSFIIKIRKFITGLIEGMTSILKMPHKWWFILQTTLIWLLYVAMFWVVLFAFPETENLGIDAVLVAFIAGSIAMVISNGGFGVYPVFVTQALLIYGISEEIGMAFGLLMWSTQTLLVIIFGLICMIGLPIFNKDEEKIN
jgi:uncharacterized protein (TIRG00374 family)